jgi:hypothetical protein
VSKYINIAVGVLVLAFLVAATWYIHHKGFESGAASRQHEVDDATKRTADAQTSLAACGNALQQANAATAAAQDEARIQRGMAQAAVEAATTQTKASKVRFDTWTQKYIEAKATADCKTQLEQTLCPAVSGY